ncbi:response regulator [Oceanobacillus massiliensis]|uniref:response regulator n=1 Tax=Oceanobacillus massiliensis TaxID=1465765 RepID=UPI00028A0CFE|nr:response regulator [Oceanobacillus massiliensis]
MQKEILVVDDQAGIRLLLNDILDSEGYSVSLASTGKEAIDRLQKDSYDLIILDYKLPIIDGKEVLNILEKEKNEIPVIVMSGMTENIITEIEKIKMVKKIIAKPFNIKDFCIQVGEILL